MGPSYGGVKDCPEYNIFGLAEAFGTRPRFVHPIENDSHLLTPSCCWWMIPSSSGTVCGNGDQWQRHTMSRWAAHQPTAGAHINFIFLVMRNCAEGDYKHNTLYTHTLLLFAIDAKKFLQNLWLLNQTKNIFITPSYLLQNRINSKYHLYHKRSCACMRLSSTHYLDSLPDSTHNL